MKGILDRIEDGRYAVILIEEVQQEVVLPVECLPEGSEIHSWFDIELEGEEVKSISPDEETEAVKEQQVDTLMEKLRAKKSRSRFKRE